MSRDDMTWYDILKYSTPHTTRRRLHRPVTGKNLRCPGSGTRDLGVF